jgi:TAP-like protein
VDKILAGLRRAPIPAPSATPPGELTYGDVLTLIKFAQLPDPLLWPTVGALLAAAEAGDASALEDLAYGYAAAPFKHAVETNSVLLCPDSPSRQDAQAWPHVVDRLEAVSRLGAAPMNWEIGAPCASWPARSANRYTGPRNAKTANPILLVGTRYDPNTPLVNAQLAERRLGNAVLLTHDGYGHLSHADPSQCVLDAVGRYFESLTRPATGHRVPVRPQALRPRLRPAARIDVTGQLAPFATMSQQTPERRDLLAHRWCCQRSQYAVTRRSRMAAAIGRYGTRPAATTFGVGRYN